MPETATLQGHLPHRTRTRTVDTRDLAVMRVSDFTTLMKLIAEEDLWNELEAALAAERCRSLRMSAGPMRAVSAVLRAKTAAGELAGRRLELASCGSWGSTPADDAGRAGAAGTAADGATHKPGDVLEKGTSETTGSQDKPQ